MHTTILGLVTRVAQATDEEIVYPDPDSVTPGVWGFVLTAVVALAVLALGFDMVRRIRRTNYRAEISERLEAELAERNAAGENGTPSNDAASPASAGEEASGPEAKP